MSDVVPSRRRLSKSDLINRIRLIKGDITKQEGIDAIVSSIGVDMDSGGSLNQALIKAVDEKLDEFILENIFKPRPGDAFALPGMGLPVKHIIYVATPVWSAGGQREDRDLLRCYRHVMQMAHRMGLKSIAFPAIGTGKGVFPPERAARLALQGIMERQQGALDEIRIVCMREDVYNAFYRRLKQVGGSKIAI